MKEVILTIKENKLIAKNTYRLILNGKLSSGIKPGSFVNLKLNQSYLRRPISVCDVNKNSITLIYKVVGQGTEELSKMITGNINILTHLGSGYHLDRAKKSNLLIGGGAGIPPLYLLAKELIKKHKQVTVILGFNQKDEVFYVNEFNKLGAKVIVTTLDGSVGYKGLVTDVIKNIKYDYVYSCGPMVMLKAVYQLCKIGEYSLEERMGCGFGACMGCSIMTKQGPKRVCKDGPVFLGEDIIW